jgi:hypothetical protein
MAFHFDYPISRPYPFRFYTAFVIISFLIATILLSLFNTIVVGYDLRVSYSTTPNATMAQKMWYDKPGFGGIKKLSSSCEPKEFGVQQDFNTDKNGFIYTLNNIRNAEVTGDLPAPSMLYLNNALEDCAINYIKIEMMKEMGRTAQQVAWQRFGPQLLAAVSCSITNMQGRMRFNFTTEYDLVPPNANKRYDLTNGGKDQWAYAAQQNLFQFVVSNNTNDPAMWWAESLMSYSWLDTALKMEQANDAEDSEEGKKWQSGSINFWPSGNTTDISSGSFFNIIWYFLQDSGSIYYSGAKPVEIHASFSSPLDQMLYSADTLAKSFYSAISADLGIVNGPNILMNEETLQSFTGNYSNIEFVLVSAGPAGDSYEALKAVTGKPKVVPSTIFTTYLCQTPERKLTTALIVSVLLANLVLLRALWSIMTFVAVHIVEARDPKGRTFPEQIVIIADHSYSKSLHAMSRIRTDTTINQRRPRVQNANVVALSSSRLEQHPLNMDGGT